MNSCVCVKIPSLAQLPESSKTESFMSRIAVLFALCLSTFAWSEGVILPACPDKPNCVSSLAADEDHAVAPIAVPEGVPEAVIWMRVRKAIEATGGEVVAQDGQRLDATYTSSLFRFVDDVSIVWNPRARVLDIRSASRTGYYDFGVNRRRVEAIRKAFEAVAGAAA
ncbi:MAG: DUF1499 domain-containing protein [Gammaproteobacteria bacterium]|nr:MAG: DUF1499 domain-containing protein [Gammaproteobacteria bacterium]